MSIRLSLELNISNTSRVRYEGTIIGSKRVRKGFRVARVSIASDTRIDHYDGGP